MSFFQTDEDFEDGSVPEGAPNKLSSLFSMSDSSSNLQFKPPQAQKKIQLPEQPQILHFSMVQLFKFDNGNYTNVGKVGAAIVANLSNNTFQLLCYRSQKDYVAIAVIRGNSFYFTIQNEQYGSFYDDKRQLWSILFKSSEVAFFFAVHIAIAKFYSNIQASNPFLQPNAASSNSNQVTMVDLQEGTTSPSDGSKGVVESGSKVSLKYTGWLLQQDPQTLLPKLGKTFDSNAKTSKLLRFKVGEKSVVQGLEAGILGMKKFGNAKRVIIIPHVLGFGSQNLQDIPPFSTLCFQVEVVPPSLSQSPSPLPSVEQPEVVPSFQQVTPAAQSPSPQLQQVVTSSPLLTYATPQTSIQEDPVQQQQQQQRAYVTPVTPVQQQQQQPQVVQQQQPAATVQRAPDLSSILGKLEELHTKIDNLDLVSLMTPKKEQSGSNQLLMSGAALMQNVQHLVQTCEQQQKDLEFERNKVDQLVDKISSLRERNEKYAKEIGAHLSSTNEDAEYLRNELERAQLQIVEERKKYLQLKGVLERERELFKLQNKELAEEQAEKLTLQNQNDKLQQRLTAEEYNNRQRLIELKQEYEQKIAELMTIDKEKQSVISDLVSERSKVEKLKQMVQDSNYKMTALQKVFPLLNNDSEELNNIKLQSQRVFQARIEQLTQQVTEKVTEQVTNEMMEKHSQQIELFRSAFRERINQEKDAVPQLLKISLSKVFYKIHHVFDKEKKYRADKFMNALIQLLKRIGASLIELLNQSKTIQEFVESLAEQGDEDSIEYEDLSVSDDEEEEEQPARADQIEEPPIPSSTEEKEVEVAQRLSPEVLEYLNRKERETKKPKVAHLFAIDEDL